MKGVADEFIYRKKDQIAMTKRDLIAWQQFSASGDETQNKYKLRDNIGGISESSKEIRCSKSILCRDNQGFERVIENCAVSILICIALIPIVNIVFDILL